MLDSKFLNIGVVYCMTNTFVCRSTGRVQARYLEDDETVIVQWSGR